jgi:hypothetical protein
MRVGGLHHTPTAVSRERNPVPIVQKAGWVPRPVWTGPEKIILSGIRSLVVSRFTDYTIPAHSENHTRNKYTVLA